MPDRANPGWSVVLKKEARAKRIASTGVEHCLGQEESSADRDVFTAMEGDRREASDENDIVEDTHARRTGGRIANRVMH